MQPTPDYSCMTDEDRLHVYEPAEDTFLLLDSLQQDSHLILSQKPTLAVEVGCGSGVVSTFLAQLLKCSPAHIMCTDINPKAAEVCRKVSLSNRFIIDPVVSDLVNCFSPRIYGLVDLLVFNPPYVVTPSDEVGSSGIAASWAGGVNGREVLDRLLPIISTVLSPKGLFYLVAIKENNVEDIADILYKQGLKTSVICERRSGPELLKVLRIQK